MMQQLRTLTIILALCGVLTFSSQSAQAFLGKKDGATAEQAGSNSFAIVDVARLMSQSKAGQALNKELQAELKALKAENDKKETGLVNEERALSKKVEGLSASEAQAAKDKFIAKFQKMKKEAVEKRKDIDTRSSKALIKLRDTVLKILKDITDEQGYDAIFAQQSVVLLDKGVNLTDDVMDKLNKELPTLSMK